MKTGDWATTDTQGRKRGDQTGLDTPVVHALNDAYLAVAGLTPSEPEQKCEVCRLGSTVARLKLKEIDGGSHKRWSMWLNSKQRAEPYLGLTCTD